MTSTLPYANSSLLFQPKSYSLILAFTYWVDMPYNAVQTFSHLGQQPSTEGAGAAALRDGYHTGEHEHWRDLPRDEEFWYEDGSIILLTADVAFKVYRQPLLEHSPVFKDMLSLPQPVNSAVSVVTTDGGVCPIVRLQDSSFSVRYVLRLLIPKKSHQSVPPISFLLVAKDLMCLTRPLLGAPPTPVIHAISAYIRLGNKY